MEEKKIAKSGLGHIDKHLTKLFLPTINLWYCIGVTPNILTTFGLVTSILSIYYFNKNKYHQVIIFIILRCYFDYADGLLARKYKLTSKFGDFYDHFVDLVFTIGMITLILLKSKNKFLHLPIIIIFYILFMIHMGCLEKEYNKVKDHKTIFSYYSNKINFPLYRYLSVYPELMRYFDNGVLYIVLIIIIINICKQN